MELTYDQFVDMVCESLGLAKETLTDETSFLNDLGVDSLSLVNFIIKIELKFGIKINLNSVWELRTIKEAYVILSKALELKATAQKECDEKTTY
jgi:acyl carrier protein